MLKRQGVNWGQMVLASVATILERTALTTIQDWYELAAVARLHGPVKAEAITAFHCVSDIQLVNRRRAGVCECANRVEKHE